MKHLIDEVNKDINVCEDIISNNKLDEAKDTLELLFDSYYGKIKDFDQGINSYSYGESNSDYFRDLKVLKRKLELYVSELKCEKHSSNPIVKIDNINRSENNNTNTNNNSINIKLLFDSARKNIEGDESLSEEEIKEIIEKINEIEEVGNEDISKNKKWGKLKGSMNWLGTKGVKVATNVLPLITAIIEANN